MKWRAMAMGHGFDGHSGDDEEFDEMLQEAYEKGYRKGMREGRGGYGEREGFHDGYPTRGGYGDRMDDDDDYSERRGVKGTGPYARRRRY